MELCWLFIGFQLTLPLFWGDHSLGSTLMTQSEQPRWFRPRGSPCPIGPLLVSGKPRVLSSPNILSNTIDFKLLVECRVASDDCLWICPILAGMTWNDCKCRKCACLQENSISFVPGLRGRTCSWRSSLPRGIDDHRCYGRLARSPCGRLTLQELRGIAAKFPGLGGHDFGHRWFYWDLSGSMFLV